MNMSYGQSSLPCGKYKFWPKNKPLCANCAWPKDDHEIVTGLEFKLQGNRFILINKRGGYQELDITPVFHFLKDFFSGEWKNQVEECKP